MVEWFLIGFVVGLWVGSRMAAYKFTSSATEPWGVEWRGRVYEVKERPGIWRHRQRWWWVW